MIRLLTTPEIERTRAAIRARRSTFAAGSPFARREAAGGLFPIATGGTPDFDQPLCHEAHQ